jgi:hypothetical protein
MRAIIKREEVMRLLTPFLIVAQYIKELDNEL